MDKSPDAFRTISEVAAVLETPAHVLRFWESRFPQIRPVKRAGGRRYYRPSDVALLSGIKRLLHDEGMTIRGVQKILRDQGVRHVAGLIEDTPTAVEVDVGLPAAREPAEAVPEAAFIAVEEDAEEDAENHVPAPAPVRSASPPQQAVLPLFDTRPAAPPPAARRADLTEAASFASLIRALAPGTLAPSLPEVRVLARRLAVLRTQMAERAQGGPL
jgi:DNA-binding transcriptional MerR regulator